MKDYFKTKQFLAKINQGNEDVFLEAYNYYAPKLFRHACFRLNSREAAEDIAQQVFYKTWQYIINPNNQIDNLSAFLYKTINNLISDYYRKSERKNLSIDEESNDLERLLVVQPSINNEIDKSFEVKEIEKTLQQLKPEQRELIIWHYFDDLSIPEIAKISGKSKNAIYVGIHRTMNILKKEIKSQNL